MPTNFNEQAATALQGQRLKEFLSKHSDDQSFWDWMNSSAIDLGLFLSVGQVIEESATQLTDARNLILWQYRIALACDKREPRAAEMIKLDEIRFQTALREPPQDVVGEASRYVLATAKPQELLFDSQRAVLFNSLVVAAAFSDLKGIVTAFIASSPQLLRDQALLSVVISAYGPALIEILVLAGSQSEESAVVARVLQRVTGKKRGEQPPLDYAADTLKWYREVEDRLVINEDALYPAPPFNPLVKLQGNCPACGSDNPPGSNFCNHCGSKLIS